jgi:hypothetical protein
MDNNIPYTVDGAGTGKDSAKVLAYGARKQAMGTETYKQIDSEFIFNPLGLSLA